MPKESFHILGLLDARTAEIDQHQRYRKTYLIVKHVSQGLFFPAQGIPLLLRARIIPLHEADAEKEDIGGLKRYTLLLRTCLEIVHSDRVRRPRIIRQRPILRSEVTDEVEEDRSATNPMLCPVWVTSPRIQSGRSLRGLDLGLTVYSALDVFSVDIQRVSARY